MSTVTNTWTADQATLDAVLAPRQDLVRERPGESPNDGVFVFELDEGPFERYRRTITVSHDTAASPTASTATVIEQVDYKLAIPLWWPYLWLLFRRAFQSLERQPRRRWWWPKETVGAETARLIAVAGTIGTMSGYLGVIIGQTITFAAKEFDAADDAQANTLAAVRIGVLASFIFLRYADRIGRRPLMIWFPVAAIVLTAAGAFSPNLMVLGSTQALARGLTTGLITLVALAATEEVPASSRALAVAFTTMTTGFGAALVVWALPLAGLMDGGWRLLYVLPVLFLPLLWWLSSRLPETRRYVVAEHADSSGDVDWGRFAMLAATSFIFLMFVSPASQLRNEFLTDDRGFTALNVTVFQLLVSVPATVSIPVGGYLADSIGRKKVGGTAILIGAVGHAASYQLSGPAMWLAALVGVCSMSAAIPALRGYSTELFPTRARGRIGGMLDVVGVAGSAVGLVIVGALAVRWDDLGSGIGVLIFGPMIAAAIIFILYPETANRELEQLNPEDPALDTSISEVASGVAGDHSRRPSGA